MWQLDELKREARDLLGDASDSSEDEASSKGQLATQEVEQALLERYAFLSRQNLSPSAPELRDLHPLPSQIPFLLDVYSENVNFVVQVVHLPTVSRMVRDSYSSGAATLTPANEALMFSIYYAAIASMEEDDVSFLYAKRYALIRIRSGLY